MNKIHLLSLPLQLWEKKIAPLGQPVFRVRQLQHWIFKNLEFSFGSMLNLPKNFRLSLQSQYTINTLSIGQTQEASDGTIKFEFRTSDGLSLESVFLPDKSQNALCLSSQIGCAMGCKFCSTGKMGFKRNCTTGEILDQYALISRFSMQKTGRKISNVLFMGMGEPLNNYTSVKSACRALCSKEGFNLVPKRITVSTCGLIPEMKKWAGEMPQIKLAVSLNGATDNLRGSLMPVNRTYPVSELSKTIAFCSKKSKWPITLEYILISDYTCTPSAALALKKYASQLRCKVNLIIYNPSINSPFISPSPREVDSFMRSINNGAFPVMLRKSRGGDISAACGQLVKQQKKAA